MVAVHHLFHTGIVMLAVAIILIVISVLAPLFFAVAIGLIVIGIILLLVAGIAILTGSTG